MGLQKKTHKARITQQSDSTSGDHEQVTFQNEEGSQLKRQLSMFYRKGD